MADPSDSPPARLGVVVIGRNEGARLIRCLESIHPDRHPTVYVDSGSTDGSPEAATTRGCELVELDMTIPFTAARARNAGLARLTDIAPDAELVQFVDGDTELAPDWLPAASAFLEAHPDVVAVAGRLHERYPERSVYNRLCDIEWDRPPGETGAVGGIATMRIAPVRDVGGFDESVIAGEEPELCVRLRLAGGKIWRLPDTMGFHDAAMTRFGQWWKRATRAGHAYAQGRDLHGDTELRHCVPQVRSILFWTIIPPLVALLGVALGLAVHPVFYLIPLGVIGLYFLQTLRIAARSRRRLGSARHALLYAAFVMLGKFAQLRGILKYHRNRRRGRQTALIEYK